MRGQDDYQILTDTLDRLGIGYKVEDPENHDIHRETAGEPRFLQGERVARAIEIIGGEPTLLFNEEGEYLGSLYLRRVWRRPDLPGAWGAAGEVQSPDPFTKDPASFAERVMAVKRGPAAPTAEDVG